MRANEIEMDEKRWKGKNIPNPLSTFCYLSAQGDAFGQLVDSQLAVEVRLLGGGSHLDDNSCGHHEGNNKETRTVDDDFQVGVVGWRIVWDRWMGERRVTGLGWGGQLPWMKSYHTTT